MNERPAILGNAPIFDSLVPLVRPTLPNFEEFADGVEEITRSGMVTKGQCLKEFEEAVAEHLNVKHAVGVSSCTTGLMLAYQGLGLTGEVVVPSFTFMASVSAMIWAGLRPVFADVDAGTANLDPARVEEAITPNTSAIVAVHIFGNPADIGALEKIARRHGLRLIFDAAHGFGSLYQGAPVGPQGDAQVYSLSPTKLVVAGEGGIVATNDDDLADKIRIGREYGNSGDYDSAFAGFNARMPEFNALLGLHSLRRLESNARRRNEVASIFREELGLPGISFQEVRSGNRISYKDFSCTIDPDLFGLTRDELATALAAENIDTRKYYFPPVHRQTAYSQFSPGDDLLPNTNLLSAQSLSIPIWSHMDDATALGICRAVQRIHNSAGEVRLALQRTAMEPVA
jgi:dTDP-4-amino-4,6-dideoxygalactose transaminase